MARPAFEPLLAAGKRYVFYTSLLSEGSSDYVKLGKYAQSQVNHFKSKLSMTEPGKGGSQIMQAINFLKDSAEFERTKELNFFQHYATSYPEIQQLFKNMTVKDIENNYIDFITDINRAIKGTEQIKKVVNSELKRITENRIAADDEYRKGKELKKTKDEELKKQYELDIEQDKNIQHINNARVFFRQANNSDKSFFNALSASDQTKTKAILTTLILKNYGAKLFSWQNNKGLHLNEQQKSMLVAALTMKANELFVTDFTNIYDTDTKAENVVTSEAFKKMVNVLLNSPDLLNILESLRSQYNMEAGSYEEIKENSKNIERIERSVEQSFNNLTKEEKRNLNYDQWRKQVGLTRNDIRKMIAANNTVSVLTYYVGEDLALVDWIMNGLGAALGGGKNPTDDLEAGALITDIEYDSNKLKQLEQELWERQAKHFRNVGATSTYESFMKNTNELIKAREEQEAIIQKFLNTVEKGEKGMKDMLAHINLHSTVKGYQSAGSYAFEKEGGFGGAAFGSTLDSELKIIDSMAQAGGLDPLDIDDLFIAMINCGRLMIGEELKPTVENYFSAFMGMLMFNDAQLFAQDVKTWIGNQKELTTVQDLHMYQLNGIIVPSSFILQETYNAMSKLQTMDETYKGVRANFSTYNRGPIEGDWEATSQAAIENTKLERMHFLAGFVDLLRDIEKRLSNI